jgi:hypothetical protein
VFLVVLLTHHFLQLFISVPYGVYIGGKRFPKHLLIILSRNLLSNPLLELYEANLLNASSSFSRGVNGSHKLTDESEAEFGFVGV